MCTIISLGATSRHELGHQSVFCCPWPPPLPLDHWAMDHSPDPASSCPSVLQAPSKSCSQTWTRNDRSGGYQACLESSLQSPTCSWGLTAQILNSPKIQGCPICQAEAPSSSKSRERMRNQRKLRKGGTWEMIHLRHTPYPLPATSHPAQITQSCAPCGPRFLSVLCQCQEQHVAHSGCIYIYWMDGWMMGSMEGLLQLCSQLWFKSRFCPLLTPLRPSLCRSLNPHVKEVIGLDHP